MQIGVKGLFHLPVYICILSIDEKSLWHLFLSENKENNLNSATALLYCVYQVFTT